MQRYLFDSDGCMEEDEDGEWLTYHDHLEALEEVLAKLHAAERRLTEVHHEHRCSQFTAS